MAVDLAPLVHGPADGGPGDLVEHHALDRDAGGEDLDEVPGDRLAFPVLVRGQVQLLRPAQQALELGDLRLLLLGHDVEGLEVVVGVDTQPGPGLTLVGRGDLGRSPGQVADVADGGLDHEVVAEEARDGAGLGRRLDDDQGLGHGFVEGLADAGGGVKQPRASGGRSQWPWPGAGPARGRGGRERQASLTWTGARRRSPPASDTIGGCYPVWWAGGMAPLPSRQ